MGGTKHFARGDAMSTGTSPIAHFKKYLIPVAVSTILWFATFPCVNIVFAHVTPQIVITKVLQLPLLVGGLSYLWWMIVNRLNDRIRKQAIIFLAYGLLYMVLLVFIWPGGWRWDDLIQLGRTVQNGTWPIWQHYLTTFFYMLCMITVPVPGFIVFVEGIIIAGINASIITRIVYMMPSKTAVIATVITAFSIGLLPPALNMNLYPLRSGIHSHLEILMFTMIAERYVKHSIWKICQILTFSLVAALTTVWKTECMIFLVIVPILLMILRHRGERIRLVILATASLFAMTIVLGSYQYTGIEADSTEGYTATIYMPSLPYFAHEATQQNDIEYLSEFREIYNTELLLRAYDEQVKGEILYYSEEDWPYTHVPPTERNETYYSKSRNLFIEGIFKYPQAFVQSRWDQVVRVMNWCWSPNFTRLLFENKGPYFDTFRTSYLYNRPVNNDLRNVFTSYIESKSYGSEFKWTYNPFIPLVILLGTCVVLLVRKWRLSMLAFALLGHNLVVFLSAPAYYFMYYYSMWIGASLVVSVIVGLIIYPRIRELGDKDLTIRFTMR